MKLSKILSFLLSVMLAGSAFGQTGVPGPPSNAGPMYAPNWYQGYVPTPYEWQIMWSNKISYFATGIPIQFGGTGATNAAAARAALGVVGTGLNSGQIYVGNASNIAAAVFPTGDLTINNAGIFTVTKTNGNLFTYFATGTDASHLTGTVPVGTLPIFGTSTAGAVPASGGGSSNFLRADGTWQAPPGFGTVTSVAMTVPGIMAVGGSPITGAGTLAVTLQNQNPNLVWAGPTSGGGAAPTFRSLVAADIPGSLPYVTSVGLTLPAMFTVSGSPVTSSGSLTAVLANQSANTFLSGPSSGGATTPSFRGIGNADLGSISVLPVGVTATTNFTIGTHQFVDIGNGQLNLASSFLSLDSAGGIIWNRNRGPISSSDSYKDGTLKVTGVAIIGLSGNINGTNVISSVSPNPITAGVEVGSPLIGSVGIPINPGTFVTAVTSNSITMNQNATTTASAIDVFANTDTNFTIEPAIDGGGAYLSINRKSGANEERLLWKAQNNAKYAMLQATAGSGAHWGVDFSADGQNPAWSMETSSDGVTSYFRLPNSKAIFARNNANTTDLDIFKLTNQDVVQIGSTASGIRIPVPMVFTNNTKLAWENSGGTAGNAMTVDGSNNVDIGDLNNTFGGALSLYTGGVARFTISTAGVASGALATTTVNGQACTLGITCTITAAATSIAPGTTTVSPNTNPKGLFYNNAGLVGVLASGNNGIWITDGSGNTSNSTTLPNTLTIPQIASLSIGATPPASYIAGAWAGYSAWYGTLHETVPGDLQTITFQSSAGIRTSGIWESNASNLEGLSMEITAATDPPDATLNTSSTTAIGNPTLHFTSVPSGAGALIINGAYVANLTHPSSIPAGTIISGSPTGTTVTLSANVASPGVSSGDQIVFYGPQYKGNRTISQSYIANSGSNKVGVNRLDVCNAITTNSKCQVANFVSLSTGSGQTGLQSNGLEIDLQDDGTNTYNSLGGLFINIIGPKLGTAIQLGSAAGGSWGGGIRLDGMDAVLGTGIYGGGLGPFKAVVDTDNGAYGYDSGGGAIMIANYGSGTGAGQAQWVGFRGASCCASQAQIYMDGSNVFHLNSNFSTSINSSTGTTISGGLTVTSSFTATGLVTNANLANPATTVNGQSCILGSSCTITAVAAAGTLTGTTLASNVVNSSLVGVGTLTNGTTGAGFTIALGTATITGTLPQANDPALTGDITKSAGNAATTLAAVATGATTGSSTAIPVVTFNNKGLVTGITTAAVVAPAGTLSGSTLASGVTASSLTSVGTLTNLSSGATTISTGSPGAFTPIADADDLVVKGPGNTGISIASPDANNASLVFGSPSTPGGFQMIYNHDAGTMQIYNLAPSAKIIMGTGVNNSFQIDSADVITHSFATILNGSLTYGGVTWSNSSSGTGSPMLTDSATWTTVLTGPKLVINGTPNFVIGTLNAGGVTGAGFGGDGGNMAIRTYTSGGIYLQGPGGSPNFAHFTGSGLTLDVLTSDAAQTDSSLCANGSNLVLKGSGTLGICLGTSSARYKNRVEPLDDGLAKIVALEPKNFFYNKGKGDDGARIQVGFLAEDVIKVMSNLVDIDADAQPNTVDILGMVPVLVNAVKELKISNDNLAAQVEILKRAVK